MALFVGFPHCFVIDSPPTNPTASELGRAALQAVNVSWERASRNEWTIDKSRVCCFLYID